MNLKRILSTALLVVMLFTTVIAAFPLSASAAYSESGASANSNVPEGYKEANLNKDQVEAYLQEYLAYNYDSAAKMLNEELEKGYLYYANSPGMSHTIFVNKYTGFVYYVNNTTGQILTSNPISPATAPGNNDRENLMSQVVVKYAVTANSTVSSSYNSFRWAASRSQISVAAISGGIRVNYTLGDTDIRFLLPGMATAEDFEATILIPLLDRFTSLIKEYCGEIYPDFNFSFFDNDKYEPYVDGVIDNTQMRKYLTAMVEKAKKAIDKTPEYSQLYSLQGEINSLCAVYIVRNPNKSTLSDSDLASMNEKYPITKEGIAIYEYNKTKFGTAESKRSYSETIKKYCTGYTFSIMYEQEDKCGYVDEMEQKPVFRCSLEYKFNSDGSLSVRLPASSIVFDESVYTLESITPLQYFGGADMSNDGYLFYPDGSGTIIDFDDFYSDAKTIAIEMKSPIYGLDYCYSTLDDIDGIAHRAQVTMPVFGIVNEVEASDATKLIYGKDTVTNGYFAIIEEGSSLANLCVSSGGDSHKFIGAYAYYTPYPSDTYDLSETLSVGSLGEYKIVSKSKYTGSYVTRYVMLTDEELGNKCNELYGGYGYYASDYVGMATYYRDYLKNNGVLEKLDDISAELPLYIEALGAMDITARFLSFPVTKTIPLTTFENVSKIYEELSNCEQFVVEKIAEFQHLASIEKDEVQKYQYEKQAQRYADLVGKIQNIKNINFKLTGFANGGMDSTYPAKLKWVKACGGNSGFKKLIKDANEISSSGTNNFSVYPEFDFMYIGKTASFDGISIDGNVSLMVDNRYASKQLYNSIMQEYETFFTMVVSPDVLGKLYTKFNKKYDDYKYTNISISTLGSDLNSNFDRENPINRDEAMNMVDSLLDTMVNEDGYEIMVNTGNAYTLQYAKHILNMPIDSSHHRYTSYTVPFTAIVLHSYVNYTGEPLNYSGSPAYDRLRAIESGAAPYYIVCFQNTSYMKDNDKLSKYYGVDYHNWFDDIVENYCTLNQYIGGLQDYEIVDHDILIAEREIDSKEMARSYVVLQSALLEILEEQLIDAADEALAALKSNPANYGKRIKLFVNMDALKLCFSDMLNLGVENFDAIPYDGEVSFNTKLAALVGEYTAYYCGAFDAEGNQDAANTVNVEFKFSIEDLLIDLLREQATEAVEKVIPKIAADTDEAKRDSAKLSIQKSAILNRFAKILGKTVEELAGTDFAARVDAVIAELEGEFDGKYGEDGQFDAGKSVVVKFDEVTYPMDLYVTDSCALDEDYVKTHYTIDNGNVTMVTYKKGDSVVKYILNYNNYQVTVRLSAGQEYEVPAYGVKIVD